MDNYYLAQTIAVTIASVVAVGTLALGIIKELVHSKCILVRPHLEYQNNFGDFLANLGTGVMIIEKVNIYYDDTLVNCDYLVDVYVEKLNLATTLKCITYLSNEELLGRVIPPQEKLKLVEINPMENGNSNQEKLDVFVKLCEIRSHIKLEITYKGIYGIKKTKKI